MELSSKKLFYNNEQPMSDAYLKLHNKDTSNFIFKKLTETEIEEDIINIQQILKNKFRINKIVIITHFNINEKNNIIYEKRQKLIDELEKICGKYNIKFINPVKALKEYNIIESDLKHFIENNIITQQQYTLLLHILNTRDYRMNYFMSDYIHYNGINYFMHYFMNYVLFKHLENI